MSKKKLCRKPHWKDCVSRETYEGHTKELQERIKELEAELIEVKRARNIEQGAWEEVKKYQDENKQLRERIEELEAENKKLADTIRNALTGLAIVNMPTVGLNDVATNEEILKTMGNSFRQVLKGGV